MRMAWPRERISFDNRLIIINYVAPCQEHILHTALGGWSLNRTDCAVTASNSVMVNKIG